jgi:alkanesulfonate monooxygenase SsuD/methylene tetrahydromethanopterin reductase-like flavin-dependent oxidoreductase (luciferase family)
MRLGIWMMPLHPPDRPLWSTLDENIEKSLLADELGFDELWVGEHFSASSEPIPSPLMFLAYVLARTKKLTFGTAAINLPNRNPAVVAAEAAQFDHLSKGRFMMGVGPGGLPSDFELFNVPDQEARNRMVVEAVDLIQRIWSQDPPYDLKGEFWHVRINDRIVPDLGIGYLPKPFRKMGPPIYISVANLKSRAAHVAAQRGWGMLSANTVSAETIASHWAVYRETCAAIGRSPRGDDWRVSRNILVAPSASEARDRVFHEHGANRFFYSYLHNAQRAHRTPDPEAVAAMIELYAIYGSPKDTLDKLIDFRERVGPFGGLLITGLDWSGPNKDWESESMRLLAHDVMPKFRQHLRAGARVAKEQG